MWNLEYIVDYARSEGLNFSGHLRADECLRLARDWVPHLRFVEDERFFPMSPYDYLDDPPSPLVQCEETPGDFVERPAPLFHSSHQTLEYHRQGLDSPEITADSRLTCLRKDIVFGDPWLAPDYDVSRDHYGASVENVWVRHDGEFFPTRVAVPTEPIQVIAEVRSLLEVLEYQVRAHSDLGYPRSDATEFEAAGLGNLLFGGYSTKQSLHLLDAVVGAKAMFRRPESIGDLDALTAQRLLELIAANAEGDDRREAELLRLLEGVITPSEWHVVKELVLVEYVLYYAYSDLKQRSSRFAVGANEHEGDLEGCCVAFLRRDFDALDGMSEAERAEHLSTVLPVAYSTSVHGSETPSQVRDLRIPGGREERRERLVAWVARGSHATYLDGVGSRDLPSSFPSSDAFYGAAAASCVVNLWVCAAAAALSFILDKARPKDVTSDDGYQASPPTADPPAEDHHGTMEVTQTPLSGDANIFDDPIDEPRLRTRLFPGRWGGHVTNALDQSPRWEPKTGDYVSALAALVDNGHGFS